MTAAVTRFLPLRRNRVSDGVLDSRWSVPLGSHLQKTLACSRPSPPPPVTHQLHPLFALWNSNEEWGRVVGPRIGSIASIAAGAAKEIADELGFFKFAGASTKDAVADLLGIFLAVVVLSLSKFLSHRIKQDQSIQGLGHEIV